MAASSEASPEGAVLFHCADVEYKELHKTIEDAEAKINATGKGRIVFEADSPKLEDENAKPRQPERFLPCR